MIKVGLLDIDTKREADNHGRKKKYPNIAVGKIYGYHKLCGDEIIYPWNGERVDKLYISTLFSWTKKTLIKNLPYYETLAKEVIIGGTGWDDYSTVPYKTTKLPPEIEMMDPKWAYELYDIDYGIGKTSEGCHVGCGFCMVPKKEGLKEYRVNQIKDIINPKFFDRNVDGSLKYPESRHITLMNNNSLADPGFYDDVAAINELGLSVHWDQANDITLINDKNAAALASVDYRAFNGKRKALYFAADLMVKRKLDPQTKKVVTFDMMKVIPEKVELMKKHGIKPFHLNFYMLIGWNTTLEEDMARFNMLRGLGCEVYAMLYRDLTGKVGVDHRGNPQPIHVKPFRDWVNGHAFRNVEFEQFDRYIKAQERDKQLALF